MQEWLNWPARKAGVPATVPWVRIPPPPRCHATSRREWPLRSAFGGPARFSSPHSGCRRGSAPRISGVWVQLPALAGSAGFSSPQVPAGLSSPHSGCRRGSAPRISGARERQLPAFAGSVSASSPHSRDRRRSAPRIREAGEVQLPALAGSVSVSSPHSRSRRLSAPRIHEAGEVQLPAFAGPVGLSSPHSRSRWGSAPRIRGACERQLFRTGGADGAQLPRIPQSTVSCARPPAIRSGTLFALLQIFGGARAGGGDGGSPLGA